MARGRSSSSGSTSFTAGKYTAALRDCVTPLAQLAMFGRWLCPRASTM
jgi:hypothetical protein